MKAKKQGLQLEYLELKGGVPQEVFTHLARSSFYFAEELLSI